MNYRIGLLRLYNQPYEVQTEYGFILTSIIEQIGSELEDVATHNYTETERDMYAQFLRDEEVRRLRAEIDQLLASRDTAFFSTTTTEEQREMTSQTIAEREESIACVRDLPLSMIEIVEQKPLELVIFGDDAPPAAPPLDMYAQLNNLDIIVRGDVRQQDEFFRFNFVYYQRASDRIVNLGRYTVGQDEFSFVVRAVADDLAEIVVGGAWGNVDIRGLSDRDVVYIEDTIVGFGDNFIRYQPIGDYTINVRNADYDAQIIREITVDDREITVVDFEITRRDVGQIRVTSAPPGAAVYLNSIWQGFTPVEVARPEVNQQMIVRYDDYFDAKLVVAPQSEDEIHVTLNPAIFDQSQWIFSRRDRFYDAFAAFIISVPLPIIFAGIYENLDTFTRSASFSSLSADEQQQITTNATLAQTGQTVGVFISGALLINAIIEIVAYVRAAELYHRL